MLLWALLSCGLLAASVISHPVKKTVADIVEDAYGQRSSEQSRNYDSTEAKWAGHHLHHHHHHIDKSKHDFIDVITDYTHVGKPGVVQPVKEQYSVSGSPHVSTWEEQARRRADHLPPSAPNTGMGGDDFHFATAPPLPGKRYPTIDEGHGKYPKDEPYRPSGEEVREWEENREAKQKMFLQKYEDMEGSWGVAKGTGWDLDMRDEGREKGEEWVNVNNDYYTKSSKAYGFKPKKYFYDFYNHNISKTDIAIKQSLF